MCVTGSNAGKETPPSSSKKSKEKEDKPKESESKDKDKDKGKKVSSSFPPSNTTDAVRLKCRELLANAIRTDSKFLRFTNIFGKTVMTF